MAQPSLQSPVHGSTLWPELPPSPLTGICVVRLDEAWERPLQRFYEANPQYFLEALGQPPASDEAIQEIRDLPPEDFSYTELFLLGFVQEVFRVAGLLRARPLTFKGSVRGSS